MQVEKGEEADKIEEGNVTGRGIETTSFVLLSEIQRQLFNLPANKHNMCNQVQSSGSQGGQCTKAKLNLC